MNCVELERDLPECVEGSPTPEQQAHLNSCPACFGLLLELNAIATQAKFLSGTEDPSPAVWDALESRLRSEGLIRRSEPVYASLEMKESFLRRWRASWLVPVAAALAIVAGVKLYRPAGVGDNSPVVKQAESSTKTPVRSARAKVKPPVSREDQQWLESVADRPPAQLARFRSDLDDANEFIQDAQESLQHDPSDIYMQQMLINAYEQKQMLYDLAVDNGSQ
jgi:hypothetical protein